MSGILIGNRNDIFGTLRIILLYNAIKFLKSTFHVFSFTINQIVLYTSDLISMQRIFADNVRVNLDSSIYSGGNTYEGIIEYISREGMEYLIGSSMKVTNNFTPSQTIQLNLTTPSGCSLNLTCHVICFLRSGPEDEILSMGIKVLNPPPQYMDFVETLKRGELCTKWG